jgi:hypothetical protein
MALADARDLVAKYVNGCVVERKQGTTARHTHATFHPADPPVISLARGAPKWVVCHEIAHAINEGRDRGHGAYFRHDYLVIVELELGPWWARRLRAAFKKVGYES